MINAVLRYGVQTNGEQQELNFQLPKWYTILYYLDSTPSDLDEIVYECLSNYIAEHYHKNVYDDIRRDPDATLTLYDLHSPKVEPIKLWCLF